MKTRALTVVVFLTLAAGVATAAIQNHNVKSPALSVPDQAIPRIVVTANRSQALAEDDCEPAIPRVVVTAPRDSAG